MTAAEFIRSAIGRKALMAATGAFLGLFLLIHLIGNSTTFFGRVTFTSYAIHFHALGRLLVFFELVLLTILACHVILAAILYFENLAARPIRYYNYKSAGGRTLGSRSMPYTGLLILLFIVLHVKTFRSTDPTLIAEMVRHNLSKPLTGIYYIISLIALAIHTSHGFWSVCQSLGISGRRYEKLLQKSARTISVIGGILFILIPVLIMTWPGFLR